VGGFRVAEEKFVGLTWKAFLSEQKADCVSFRRSSAIVAMIWCLHGHSRMNWVLR
jgi:hypothetical protein